MRLLSAGWIVVSYVAVVLLGSLCVPVQAKPKYTTLPHPSPEQLEAGLKQWADQHPESIRVEVRGKSKQGRPIVMARVTDYGVPDEDKQVAMLTSCHCATELNAPCGLLRLTKWLIGEDPAAAEIRKNQIVLVVPYSNPDGVAEEGKGSEVYVCWGPDGVTNPKAHPEAVALQRIMDEYMPDLHIDYHGFSRAEQKMWETTAMSWASGLSRCYLQEVPHLIDDAADAEGFFIIRNEGGSGQIRATCDIPGANDHFYLRSHRPNITIYPYNTFHTLSFIIEAGFEESIVARTRRALQLGQERYRGERYPGYPTNQVGCWTSMAISAWGETARQRRLSRCELWQKLSQMQFGCAHPEPRGSITAVCATTPAGAEKFLKSANVDAVVEKLKDDPRFDGKALADVADRIPAVRFGISKYFAKYDGKRPAEKIEHGLNLRLIVPYADAEVTEIRLDGHLLEESATDGYQLRGNPGTTVEIAIPPGKVQEFHIASCFYDSPTRRRAGFRPEDWD